MSFSEEVEPADVTGAPDGISAGLCRVGHGGGALQEAGAQEGSVGLKRVRQASVL